MLDWLSNELEYKTMMDGLQTASKSCVLVKDIQDLYDVQNPKDILSFRIDRDSVQTEESISIMPRFPNVKRITFDTQFNGKINTRLVNAWIAALPNLCELGFFNGRAECITWEDLALINLAKIKKLHLRMTYANGINSINAPVLEELWCWGDYNEKLSPLECLSTHRNAINFSGMPKLRSVKLHNFGLIDYSSLGFLKKLDWLDIVDYNLFNIDWLSSNYSLKNLSVCGRVENISGIQSQHNIESLRLDGNQIAEIGVLGYLENLHSLDLRGNLISDAVPLEKLTKLEYLNIERNPLKSEGTLRAMGIKTLLITPLDFQLQRIDTKISEFSQFAYLRIRSADSSDVEKQPAFVRDRILAERSMQYGDRLKKHIQQAFESLLAQINPFDLPADDYDFSFKDEYIRRAIAKYPFLTITPTMTEQIQNERDRRITRIPAVPGISFFSNEDFVRVYVKVKSGSGKIKQGYDKRYYRHSWMVNSRKIETAVKKNWDLFFPSKKLTELDFDITYAPLYGKEVDAKIAYAVLYAMWSAVFQIVLPQKTAVLLQCSGTGRLSKEEATLRQINASRRQGIENLISWTPKKKTVRHTTAELTLFNTLEEFVADLHRQETAHNKFKDLDTFRLKLVDVIQQHIPDIADQRKIQAILRDFFPEKKKDVNILLLLLQMNILEKIKTQPNIDGFFVSKFVSMLENDYAIGSESARYAVHTWCLCYGKYILDKPCDL